MLKKKIFIEIVFSKSTRFIYQNVQNKILRMNAVISDLKNIIRKNFTSEKILTFKSLKKLRDKAEKCA